MIEKSRYAQCSFIWNKLFANVQARNKRRKGAQFIGRRITIEAPNLFGGRRIPAEGAENPDNVTNTFFSGIHLLSNDPRFEYGGR